MTLDEAIAKAKADGDVQLAEWLRQARGADAAARWYTERLRNADRTIRKLQTENAKLRKLARWMYQVMDESCATHYPYEPAPVSMQALMRAEKELQALGIEV